MRNRMTAKVLVAAAIGAAAVAAGVPAAYATTGTWNTNFFDNTANTSVNNGLSNVASSWLGGVIPNGNGDTANFVYALNRQAKTINIVNGTTYGTINIGTPQGSGDTNSDVGFQISASTAGSILFLDAGIIGKNAGELAQVTVLNTDVASTIFGNSTNLTINLVDDTQFNVRFGEVDLGKKNFTLNSPLAGNGNLILMGGGSLVLGNRSHVAYGGTMEVVNGVLQTASSDANIFGNAAAPPAAGNVIVRSGGTLYLGSSGGAGSANSSTAVIHLNGIGQQGMGALSIDSTFGNAAGSIVLDTASRITGSGTINSPISGTGALTVYGSILSGTGRVLTLNANNTYSGGTTIGKGGSTLALGTAASPTTGLVDGNVTVEGLAELRIFSTVGLKSGQVILRNGYLTTPTNQLTTLASPTGDMRTVGGGLVLGSDILVDPNSIIASTSTGYVAIGATTATNFNVAAWGDGSVRLGAASLTGTAATVSYTGNLSANRGGLTTLNLGDCGTIDGVYRGEYSTLSIDNVLDNANMTGVNIKSGIVAFTANNTYTGATTIDYDGRLNLQGAGAAGGAVNVNAGGILDDSAGLPNTLRGLVTVNAGGSATLGTAGAATAGVVVQGTDPLNGASAPYNGQITYSATGAANSVTINKSGLVTLIGVTPQAASDLFVVNNLGVVRASSAQLVGLVPGSTLTAANGAVFQDTTAAAGAAQVATLATALGNGGNYYYGFGQVGSGTDNWIIGTTSNTPWKGLAGGNNESITVANGAIFQTVALSGDADLVGLPNGLASSAGGGNFGTIGTNAFTVDAAVVNSANSVTSLTIRGGGTVVMNNVNNTFTAPITVTDTTTLNVDLSTFGAADPSKGALGDANNSITLSGGGRILLSNSNTTTYSLASGHNITVGTGGGGINIPGTSTNPNVVSLSKEGQITGTGKLTKLGFGTLAVNTNNTGFNGDVNVVGGTLQLVQADSLRNARSISVGTAQQGLVPVYLTVQSADYLVDGLTNRAGAILLNPAITYNLNSGGGGVAAMNLNNIVLNGGAMGFTADKALAVSDFNLGSQKYVSSLNAPAQTERTQGVTGNGTLQGEAIEVKLLNLGGVASNGNMTLPGGGITDALGGGTAVAVMKTGMNSNLDLRNATSANTYSGGTYIQGGEVRINAANQLGTGGVFISSNYAGTPSLTGSEAGMLHVMDNDGNSGTLNTVTMSSSNIFRFAASGGGTANLGTVFGTNILPALINVDAGVKLVVPAYDDSYFTGTGGGTFAMIGKTGLGTLSLPLATNNSFLTTRRYNVYLKQGTLELDSMPQGAFNDRFIIFDGGDLTMLNPPVASTAGDMHGDATGFGEIYVRTGVTSNLNLNSGAKFKVGVGGGGVGTGVWNGTLIVNGADLTSLAVFEIRGRGITNGNGALDIRGGTVAIPHNGDLSAGGSDRFATLIPVINNAFTLSISGGEFDGNDQQFFNAGWIAAKMNINLPTNAPVIPGDHARFGGGAVVTVNNSADTTWYGQLEKVGSGTMIFNRNGGTFLSSANTALTITGGQFVVDGNGAFDSATFIANKVAITNNSATDTGIGDGLVFRNTSGNSADDVRYAASISGTGGTLIGANTTLLVGSSPGNISQGTMRINGNGNLRNDGQAFLASFNSALAGTVNLNANVNNALFIDTGSTAKVGDVTLANTSTGGILNGSLIAHSLTISGASAFFTMNAGSNLTLDPTVTNNGTFTYNGGTTNATGINSTSAPLGTLLVNSNMALNEVRQGVKVQVASGTVLTLNANSGGNSDTIGGSDANYSLMGQLVLAGTTNAWTSKFDINDNKLIIENGNTAGTAAQVQNQLKQAFDNSAWDGTGGITSSKAAAALNNNGVPVTIGVMDNNDGSGNVFFYGDGTTGPTFGTLSVNEHDTLMKYTYFGDADLSGSVDSVDYGFFVAGVAGVGTGWQWGDFDYSGGVPDSVDYGWFVFGFSAQGAPLATGGGPTSVPEPASLALLGLGGLLMLKRRNRKS